MILIFNKHIKYEFKKDADATTKTHKRIICTPYRYFNWWVGYKGVYNFYTTNFV